MIEDLLAREAQLKKLHPTAIVATESNSGLFIVHYPGLKLAISVTLMIAFNVNGEWHYSNQYSKSKTTRKNKLHFVETFKPTKIYDTNISLQSALRELLHDEII